MVNEEFLDNILKRRGVNPNRIPRRVDLGRLGNNFQMVGKGNIIQPYRPNFTLGEASGLMYNNIPPRNLPIPYGSNTPSIYNAKQQENAKILDELYKNKKNIANEIGGVNKVGSISKIGNFMAKYAPVTSDIYDVGAGINKIKSGHPFIGGAQTALGVGGLGADALAAIAIATGVGSPAGVGGLAAKQALKSGVKQVGKQIIKAGGKDLLKNASKNYTKMGAKRALASIGLELLPTPNNYPDGNSATTQPTTSTNNNKRSSNSLNRYSNLQGSGGGMSPDFVNNLVAIKGLNAGGEPGDIEVGENGQLDTTPQSTAMDGILEYMKNRQDKLQPYMDKLNEFVDNYKDYNKGYEDTDIFFRGLAGWTGNPAWATYAKDHNPASTEATQIDLYRKLAEQDLAEEDKYQEILGNIAMAEAMGLPPEAALANPKMISNNIQMQKLQQTLQTRREIANLNAKEKELDRQARIAMRQGDWKNAQLLQGMRNEASMKRTILEGASYGDPANINNALKALGYDIQLDNTGNGEVSY